jgi:hypothetical protein
MGRLGPNFGDASLSLGLSGLYTGSHGVDTSLVHRIVKQLFSPSRPVTEPVVMIAEPGL